MRSKILTATFFISWLVTGCSLESFFEGKGNAVLTIVAAAVAIGSVWAMNKK